MPEIFCHLTGVPCHKKKLSQCKHWLSRYLSLFNDLHFSVPTAGFYASDRLFQYLHINRFWNMSIHTGCQRMLKQSSRFLLPRITASACKKLGIVHSTPMPLFLFLFSTFFNCAVGHSSYFGMIDSARRGRYNKIVSVYGKKIRGTPYLLGHNPKR